MKNYILFSIGIIGFAVYFLIPPTHSSDCNFKLPYHWKLAKTLSEKWILKNNQDDVIGYWALSYSQGVHDVHHLWHYEFDDSCSALGFAKDYFNSNSYKSTHFK